MKKRLVKLLTLMMIPSLALAGSTYTVTIKNGCGYAEDDVTGEWKEGTSIKLSAGSRVEVSAQYPMDEFNYYAFSGWAITPASAQSLIFNDETGNEVERDYLDFAMPSNNITLTAVWIKNPVMIGVDFQGSFPDGYEFNVHNRAIEFSFDGQVWHQLFTGDAASTDDGSYIYAGEFPIPGKAGWMSATVKLRSQDPRWSVPPTYTAQDLGYCYDEYGYFWLDSYRNLIIPVSRQFMIAAEIDPSSTGNGTVSPEYGNWVGDIIPSGNGLSISTIKPLKFVAKPDRDSVFAYWTYETADDVPEFLYPQLSGDFTKPTLNVSWANCDATVRAVFKKKSDCVATPVLSRIGDEEIVAGKVVTNRVMVGDVLAVDLAVDPCMLPVKLTASGLPSGIKVDDGYDYVFADLYGTPTKAGTYTVTIKLANEVNPKLATEYKTVIEVLPVPSWAIGSYYGYYDKFTERRYFTPVYGDYYGDEYYGYDGDADFPGDGWWDYQNYLGCLTFTYDAKGNLDIKSTATVAGGIARIAELIKMKYGYMRDYRFDENGEVCEITMDVGYWYDTDSGKLLERAIVVLHRGDSGIPYLTVEDDLRGDFFGLRPTLMTANKAAWTDADSVYDVNAYAGMYVLSVGEPGENNASMTVKIDAKGAATISGTWKSSDLNLDYRREYRDVNFSANGFAVVNTNGYVEIDFATVPSGFDKTDGCLCGQVVLFDGGQVISGALFARDWNNEEAYLCYDEIWFDITLNDRISLIGVDFGDRFIDVIPGEVAEITADCGVAVVGSLVADNDGQASKYSAKDLPAGIKLDAKTGEFSGIPTKAGVFNAQITIEGSGNGAVKSTYTLRFVVAAIPAWCKGTFDGSLWLGADYIATLTVSDVGKVSGKLTAGKASYSFTAASFSERTSSGYRFVIPSDKTGKTTIATDVSMHIVPNGNCPGTGVCHAETGFGELYQSPWKDKAQSAWLADIAAHPFMLSLRLDGVKDVGHMKFSMSKSGDVSVTGNYPDGSKISGKGKLVMPEIGQLATWIMIDDKTLPNGYAILFAQFDPLSGDMSLLGTGEFSPKFTTTANLRAPVVMFDDYYDLTAGVLCSLPVWVDSETPPTVSVKGLPAGLKFDPKAMVITGVPTKASTNLVTISAKNDRDITNFTCLMIVEPLPLWATGGFNGMSLLDGSNFVTTITIGADGKISGKMVCGKTSYSFATNCFDAASSPYDTMLFGGAISVKNGRQTVKVPLSFAVTPSNPYSSNEYLGIVSEDLATGCPKSFKAELYRNVWNDKVSGADILHQIYDGRYYTMALISQGLGIGYATCTIDKKGGVKIAGKLPDGTALSCSGSLIVTDSLDPCPQLLVNVAPKAYNGGFLRGIFEFDSDGFVDFQPDTERNWVSLNPQTTGDYYAGGFERTLFGHGYVYDKSAIPPVVDA